MTEREDKIRVTLRERLPSCSFVTEAPTPAGFGFGWRAGALVPAFNARQLETLTEHLSIERLDACLVGLAELCEKVIELADEELVLSVPPELIGEARAHVRSILPDISEILDDVFDFPADGDLIPDDDDDF